MNEFDHMLKSLRETEPVVADGAFTSSVMAKVSQHSELSLFVKSMILLSAALAGTGIALWAVPINMILSMVGTGAALPLVILIGVITYTLSFSVLKENGNIFGCSE